MTSERLSLIPGDPRWQPTVAAADAAVARLGLMFPDASAVGPGALLTTTQGSEPTDAPA